MFWLYLKHFLLIEVARAFLWVKDKVHESAEHGFFVAVFSEEIVGTPEQVLQLMDFGE